MAPNNAEQDEFLASAILSHSLEPGRKIPVFFLRDPNGGVHLERGEGSFFMSPEDARAKLEGLRDNEGTKVMIDK